MLDNILAALAPHLLEVIGGALTLLLGLLFAQIRAKTGIDIEARHREALHSALMTGIRLALSKGLKPQDAVKIAIGYAEQSVPDALRRLRPQGQTLEALARAKLAEVAPDIGR